MTDSKRRLSICSVEPGHRNISASNLDTKYRRIRRAGGIVWLVSQNRRRSDIEPKPRPGPKTYRKPGSAADNEPNPTHPTSTDISDVSDFGGATNAARESDTIRHIPLGMSDVGSGVAAVETKPQGQTAKPKTKAKRDPGKQVRRASQKQGKATSRKAPAKKRRAAQ